MARTNTATKAPPADDDPADRYDVTKAKTLRRGARHRRYTLSLLRKARDQTQAQVAARMGVDQGAISKLEGRSDVLVSTLRAYAAALGLEVEIALVDGERRYVVEIEAGVGGR